MLVFVDESGDPGLKLDRGSTRYFVVALVVFEENEEAEALDRRITLLRTELGLSERFEFKFNKAGKAMKLQFLNAVAPYTFFYFGIAIDKTLLYGEGFRIKESFYKYTCSLVFENAKPYLRDAVIVVDGSGSRDFRLQLQPYLKRKMNQGGERLIKKIKLQESARNNLIQLADIIAGSIARSLSQKGDARLYRNVIRHREMYVQVWPK